MLTVTPAARERLARKLARKKAGENEAMRVTRKTGGWKLAVDHARPDDTAITHDGRILLLLDEAASQAMRNATLDVQDTGAGRRLKLR
jgi:Fe-S cluster assembly iron-binding protein IscA